MVIGRSRTQEQQDRWRETAKYWKAVPVGSTLLFLSAVFCLFACVGFLGSLISFRGTGLGSAAIWALSSGSFAILYALSATRRYIRLMIATAATQVLFNGWLSYTTGHLARGTKFTVDYALQRTLIAEASLALVLVLLGYVFFIAFAGGEGKRIFATMTEVRLANDVHRALVPPIEKRIGEFEFAGLSVPSGAMGGDLVDVAEGPQHWLAYLADVSGHGIPAGMTMSMVKSAVRMRTANSADLTLLLGSLNAVLTPLSSSATFVTFACVTCNGAAELSFALAGHLPILHYRSADSRVMEHAVENFPLAAFADANFESGAMTFNPGDVLALLSDGITETTDLKGTELGLEPIKTVLADKAQAPLFEVISAIRTRAQAFGKQNDDQSILLIRRK